MKKSYSDYPNKFFEILDHFRSSDAPLGYKLAYREAASTRHAFYRFLSAVRKAAEKGDKYAEELRLVARDISISLTPAFAAPEAATAMTIYTSPLEIGRKSVQPVPDVIPLDVGEVERILAERKK